MAYFLAHGYDVVAWDPAPDAEERLRHLVDAAWPALTELGLADGADRSRLSFEPDLAKALADAQFVQESAPEDLELKVKLLARHRRGGTRGRRDLVVDDRLRHERDVQLVREPRAARSSGIRSTRRT